MKIKVKNLDNGSWKCSHNELKKFVLSVLNTQKRNLQIERKAVKRIIKLYKKNKVKKSAYRKHLIDELNLDVKISAIERYCDIIKKHQHEKQDA